MIEERMHLVEQRLRSVAVVGAAGKMGSGIAWVLLRAMAKLDAERHGVPGSGDFGLVLIDSNRDGWKPLRAYLESQLRKNAEKRITALRAWAEPRASLVENGDVIAAYVEGALSMARFETGIEGVRGAKLVFEAVFEHMEVKRDLYRRLKDIGGPDTFYFTNTSSIPITALNRVAGLGGRIVGYHFYNPPAVQKLVEVIAPAGTHPDLVSLANQLGPLFEKSLVSSHDVAGFIGNGHFIREGLFALAYCGRLAETWRPPEAVFIVNKVTRDFLLRPMGIFQLLDYVGWDVFRMILKVMSENIPGESFRSDWAEALFAAGIKGGSDGKGALGGAGEQRDGIFRYVQGKPTAVFDSESGAYLPLADERFVKAGEWLGPLPKSHIGWKALSKGAKGAKDTKDAAGQGSADIPSHLADYFAELSQATTEGARAARAFLDNSRRVAANLVGSGVAACPEDVRKVLMNGFFHLYGPAEWTF